MTESPAHVLIIDDEEIIREALDALLTMDGCVVRTAATAAEGLALLDDTDFDTVLLDLMLPDKSGLDVLDEIRRSDDTLPVVMITAFGTIDTAVRATKQGAFHYFTKPFKNDEVLVVLRNAVERRRLQRENLGCGTVLKLAVIALTNHRRQSEDARDLRSGGSRRPQPHDRVDQGESGTARNSSLRRAIVFGSRRQGVCHGQFGNLPPDLLESLLFGHVKARSRARSQ